MPIPTPKGGVMRLPADTTRGKRGDPRKLSSGGVLHAPAKPRPMGEEIGSHVRGGVPGMYEQPLRRSTPTSGDGTGQ
jgi:hypothetical protein